MKNYGCLSEKCYKGKNGISLTVLIVTSIVIIILASLIVVSISTTNPIKEGQDAKYEYDVDNIQTAFTSTASKVMVKKRANIVIEPVELNDIKSGVESTTGQVQYTVKFASSTKTESGRIIFDKQSDTDNEFYTGVKLPIYKVADTTWRVDEDGNISLKVGDEVYGKNNSSTSIGSNKIIKNFTVVRSDLDIKIKVESDKIQEINEYTYYIRKSGEKNWNEFSSTESSFIVDGIDQFSDYEIKIKVKIGEEEEESYIKTVKHNTSQTPGGIDKNAPTIISFKVSNPNFTNTEIDVVAKAIDEDDGISAYMFSRNGNLTGSSEGWTSVSNTKEEVTYTYKVRENGTYYFYVKDRSGNYNKKEIVVISIDKEPPQVIIENNGGEYAVEPGSNTAQININLNVKDEGTSGINILQYKLISSDTTSEGSGTNWKDIGRNNKIVEEKEIGTYYLYLKVIDNAGNEANVKRSNPYVVRNKIKYDANGGTNAPEEQLKNKDIDLKLNTSIPEKPGYMFLGWSTSQSESNIQYTAGATYKNNESVVLYAIWDVKNIVLTFDANGGNEPNPKTITKRYNESIGSLPVTSRQNYTFEGWYTLPTGGEKVFETSIVPGSNVTYYAHWMANKSINITKNLSDISVFKGDDITLSIEANGSDQLKYQWYFNIINSTVGGTAIDGATNSSYSTTATTEIDKKYYYCVVSATIEGEVITNTSKTALITVTDVNYSITKAGKVIKFTTLSDAAKEAVSGATAEEGGTITVLNDVTDESVANIDKSITLNTNGKTAKMRNAIRNNEGEHTLKITGGGTMIPLVGYLIQNFKGATLEIDNVNLESNIEGSLIKNTGTLNVKSGNLRSLTSNIISNHEAGQVNISGGTLVGQSEYKEGSTSTYPTIWNNGNEGKIKITGGNISSKLSNTIYNKAGGTVDISGDTTNISSENNTTIFNSATGRINITGGNISSKLGNTVYNVGGTITLVEGTVKALQANVINNRGEGQVNISGGEIIGQNEYQEGSTDSYPVIYNNDDGGKIKITGGNISSKVAIAINNKGGGTVEISGETTNISSENGHVISNSATGQINVKGGIIETINFATISNRGGILTVEGGTLNALKSNVISNSEAGQVNISGGTIIGQSEYKEGSTVTSPAIWNNDNEGKIKITGGNISSKLSTTIYNKGGGTVEISGDTTNISSENNNVIGNTTTGKIDIKGGTIETTSGRAIQNNGIVNISDGVINGCTTGTNPVIWNTNGTLNITGGTVSGIGSTAIYVASGNANISGDASITSQNYYGLFNANSGKIDISGGTIRSDNSFGIGNNGTGTLNITNGRISTVKNIAIDNSSSTEVSISGGIIESEIATVIKNNSTGTINILGGTINGCITGTNPVMWNSNANGTYNISGGTITANQSTAMYVVNGKINVSGEAKITSKKFYGIYNTNSGQVNISGGTIIGAQEGTSSAIWNNNNGGKIKITGGNISSKTANAVKNNAGGTVEISGDTTNISSENNDAIDNSATGIINIKGGTIDSQNRRALYNRGGTIEISGGIMRALKSILITNQGTGQVNINGGTLIGQNELTEAQIEDGSTYPAIWNNDNEGKIKITGGNISSKASSVIYNKAGGIIEISGDNTNIMSENNGVINNQGTGQVNINGGTIESINTSVIYNKAGIITVSNGTMRALKGHVITNNETGQVNISGGQIIGCEIASESVYPAIISNGSESIINVTGGNISTKTASAIYSEGVLTITDGTLVSDKEITLYNIGNLTINGGIIRANNSSSIMNETGANLIINGGEIIGNLEYVGINNYGTLTIGDASADISITNPCVIGGNTVYNKDSATFNFYNGILKSDTNADVVRGTITNKRSGATYTTGKDGEYNTAYYQ